MPLFQTKVTDPRLQLSECTVDFLKGIGYHYIDYLTDTTRSRFLRENQNIKTLSIKEIDNALQTANINWLPEKSFNRDKMIFDIIKVMNYRDGDYYIGSMATCRVYNIMNIPYGTVDGSVKFERDILKCSDKQIQDAYSYLESYIDYMNKNPVRQCPCCGSLVRVENFIINPDTIKRQI